MDLSALLDVTEPVECEFLSHKITAHVYTAGANRLRKEDRDLWAELNAPRDRLLQQNSVMRQLLQQAIEELQKDAHDPETVEGIVKSFGEIESQEPDGVAIARALLPVMISSWDFDGSPMERPAGVLFPPTPENIAACPDSLLDAIAGPILEKWNARNPTSGDLQQDGLPESANMPEGDRQDLSTIA